MRIVVGTAFLQDAYHVNCCHNNLCTGDVIGPPTVNFEGDTLIQRTCETVRRTIRSLSTQKRVGRWTGLELPFPRGTGKYISDIR